MLEKLQQTLLSLAIGFAGGALFYVLELPLPWTLGSLTVSAAYSLAGGRIELPPIAWGFARPVVGVLAGSAFTLPVLLSMLQWWNILLVLAVYTSGCTFLGCWYFQKFFGFDKVTAFFASAPGGLAELSTLGASLGGSMQTLALTHSVRIVFVVFLIPFLSIFLSGGEAATDIATVHKVVPILAVDAVILVGCAGLGFLIGRPFKSYGGVMLVPLMLSAVAHISGLTAASPPDWLVALVQVVIGIMAGSRFGGIDPVELGSKILAAILWVFFLIASSGLLAIVLGSILERNVLGLLLAFAPGGIVEMTIVSYAIGMEVAFVVSCQVARVLFVLFMSPILFRFSK